MIRFINRFLGLIAAIFFYSKEEIALMIVSIIVAIIVIWSWGIMHDFTVESAKKRSSYTGGFIDFTVNEIESVPNWILTINMLFTLSSLILLVVSII